MPRHSVHRRVECQVQHARPLCVGAAILTVAVLSNAATTAPAMQQVQPAFGATTATTESAAPKPLALPPPAPAGLARPATAADLKAPHAALPAASNSLGKGALDTKVNQSGKRLFEMDDRAIIIVSGKQTTAGELKKSLLAEKEKKDGPPRIVHGGTRKLDLATLNVTHSATAAVPTLSTRTLNAPLDPSTQVNITPEPSTKGTFAQSNNRLGAVIKEIRCADKGPPAVSEIKGKLKPGGDVVTVSGRCFGDRAGRVVVAGQFGQIQASVAAWDMNEIKVQLPAGIRGVGDHSVSVTVATTEGRASARATAAFVAQRERIEVPPRLWAPVYYYERSIHTNTFTDASPVHVPAAGRNGQARFALDVNKQCALDTMDTIVQLGQVGRIAGWEAGPAYAASVTVDWAGSCLDFTHESTMPGLVPFTTRSSTWGWTVCRVGFHPHATAYCPVGVGIDPVSSLKAAGAPPRLR